MFEAEKVVCSFQANEGHLCSEQTTDEEEMQGMCSNTVSQGQVDSSNIAADEGKILSSPGVSDITRCQSRQNILRKKQNAPFWQNVSVSKLTRLSRLPWRSPFKSNQR